MSDIVERLRAVAATAKEAAEEIERLRATLAESCREERSQLYESSDGGGCPRALGAEAENERLRAVLEECSDDLAAYIEHHYAQTLDYPSQKRKYDADMEPVIEARRLLVDGTRKEQPQ